MKAPFSSSLRSSPLTLFRFFGAQVADEKVGHTAGDLVLIIQEQKNDPSHSFTRDNDDLYLTVEIPLVDALVGFTHKFEHLDGHEVKVPVTGVTECDHVKKVKGEGMPRR